MRKGAADKVLGRVLVTLEPLKRTKHAHIPQAVRIVLGRGQQLAPIIAHLDGRHLTQMAR